MPLSEFPGLFSTHTDDTRFTTSRPFTQSALEQKPIDSLGPMTPSANLTSSAQFKTPTDANRPTAETR